MGTSIGRQTLTDSILDFLKRQPPPGPAMAANATPADAWNSMMNYQIGSDPGGGSRNREILFLTGRIQTITGGSPPSGSSLSDLWRLYLQAKGYTGTIDDMFAQWIQTGTI